jgi:4-diphosphocytidyl-2C-methyl-D-erythritol kinase
MIAFKSKDELQIEEYYKQEQYNENNENEGLSNELIDNIQKKNSMFIETLNPNDQINVYMVLEKSTNNHLS